MRYVSVRTLAAALVSFHLAFPSMAAVVIQGTRVVYPSNEREMSVKIENPGDAPALIQAWVDDGDPGLTPEKSRAPFWLTPPVSRINAGKSQTLRLFFNGGTLPEDKESLFWLNVLDVPPSYKNKQNQLQVAFRSRLKLIYRPEKLAAKAGQSMQSVQWRYVKSGIEGFNPTPYFVSFSKISADKVGKQDIAQGGMLAPGGKILLPVTKRVGVIYPFYIDDGGGIKPVESKVL